MIRDRKIFDRADGGRCANDKRRGAPRLTEVQMQIAERHFQIVCMSVYIERL